MFGATLSRRQFVKAGGALVVGAQPRGRGGSAQRPRRQRDGEHARPRAASSWFEIHADNTILMRTGKVEFGQGTAHTAYTQIVAEELNVPYAAITQVVMGDTDRTPDGGFSAGFLGYGGDRTSARPPPTPTRRCSTSPRRSSACRQEQLSVKNGVVSGGGKTSPTASWSRASS